MNFNKSKYIFGLILLLGLLIGVSTAVFASSDTYSNESSTFNQGHIEMLQSAFDDVGVPSISLRAMDCYASLLATLDAYLLPVHNVVNYIVDSLDFSIAENRHILVRDIANHYIYEDILIEIRVCENGTISSSIIYSICLEYFYSAARSVDITPFSNPYNRYRAGTVVIRDQWNPTAHVASIAFSARYFRRDGNRVFIDTGSLLSSGTIIDTRLVSSITRSTRGAISNGTLFPSAFARYRVVHIGPNGNTLSMMHENWLRW